MLTAVAQDWQPGRDVDLVLAEVEHVDAGDGAMQARHDAAREDDGEGPLHAGQLSVDVHLHLAERAEAGKLAGCLVEGERVALQHVAPPELLVGLTVGRHGEDGAVGVAREADGVGGVVGR